jgi:acetyltransferase
LLRRLIQIGRDEKLTRLKAVILADNRAMLHLSRKAGFKVQHESGGNDFIAEYVY